MIKAIILDVDGVIVGEKIGYNSPYPHKDVLNALKKVREKGITVCLCTAKPHYAITEIIKRAGLQNPHISDAGAVIIDPIDNIIVEKHVLEKRLVKKILQVLLDKDTYSEFYTVDDYFIQKNRVKLIKAYKKYSASRKKKNVLDIFRAFMPEIIFRTTKLEGESITRKMVPSLFR